MPIGRFEDWGTAGPLPDDGVVVRSDAEARTIVEAARRGGGPVPPIGLLGGDLCRTLGGSGDEGRLRSPDAARLRVDLGSVTLDGSTHWFVAHLVARRAGWRGRTLIAMNAEWCGALCLGPRAHPGDGLLDITDGALPWRDRLRARRRAGTGDHLPHPGLRTERTAEAHVTFDAPRGVWLDGDRVGRASRLSIKVEPAALLVVV